HATRSNAHLVSCVSLRESARRACARRHQQGEQRWSGLVAEVDQMTQEAVWAGFDYFQREAGYTRTGSHASRVGGRETGQWHEAGLAVAHWLQHTSRDGDMQLHVHSQIAHTAQTVMDGKWRGPGLFWFNQHKGAGGAGGSPPLLGGGAGPAGAGGGRRAGAAGGQV